MERTGRGACRLNHLPVYAQFNTYRIYIGGEGRVKDDPGALSPRKGTVPLRKTGMRKAEARWKAKLLFLGNTQPSGGDWGYKHSFGRKSGPVL